MNSEILKKEHIETIIELCDNPKYSPPRGDVKSIAKEVLRLRAVLESLSTQDKRSAC